MSRHGEIFDELCRRAGITERRSPGSSFVSRQEAERLLAFVDALQNRGDDRESRDASSGDAVPST